jgi:hypothetical protein
MKLVGFALLFSAWVFSVRADLTVVQKIEGAGAGEMTMKIKGDKARIDLTPQVTTIIDGKTGDIINLMHEQKSVVRMSADQVKAAMEMAAKFNSKSEKTGTGEKAKFVPTGKKEVINGFETEQYTYETPDYKGTYWIAPRYPDGAAILKQLQSINPDVWKTANTQMPDYRDFPGLPIKTTISGSGTQITTTLIAVKQDPLSDADFIIPKDFQEMKLPDMSDFIRPSATPAATASSQP